MAAVARIRPLLDCGVARFRLRSCLCTEESLNSPELLAWADRIRPAWDRSHSGLPVLAHRKIWEWVFIAQALAEREQLNPGRKGLGFGVGQDPLAALFACEGCEVVATDMSAPEDAESLWRATNQHASGLAHLNQDGICDPSLFDRAVRFRGVDMRDVPKDLRDFDFTWSACAFEHLGSLCAGEEFILRQMDCLRPGGYAVHTTEFNVSSDTDTVGAGDTVLYRRRDLDHLVKVLRSLGHAVEIDYETGTRPADLYVDHAPWSSPHLKIQLGQYVATSMAIIIEKGQAGRTRPWKPDPAWRARRARERMQFGPSSKYRAVAGRRARNRPDLQAGAGPPEPTL